MTALEQKEEQRFNSRAPMYRQNNTPSNDKMCNIISKRIITKSSLEPSHEVLAIRINKLKHLTLIKQPSNVIYDRWSFGCSPNRCHVKHQSTPHWPTQKGKTKRRDNKSGSGPTDIYKKKDKQTTVLLVAGQFTTNTCIQARSDLRPQINQSNTFLPYRERRT